ncbi:MAG: response regulator, partial [bacterium]|nr:response regulator [bacterium]
YFYYNRKKMEEIINNLLINAVKNTPPNGDITVSTNEITLQNEDDEIPREFVEISVKDSGTGIPNEYINSIFDRFKTKNGEGTGIGLALVKEYVQLHHGKIDVHSVADKGAEFVLRFPAGGAHLKSHQVTRESVTEPPNFQPYRELEKPLPVEEQGEIENSGDRPTVEDDDSQKHIILVVEDNPDMRSYICDPLKPDYIVVEAKDGEEGIKKAGELIPDLIISDVMMPGKD